MTSDLETMPEVLAATTGARVDELLYEVVDRWPGASKAGRLMCSDRWEKARYSGAQLRHDLGEVTGVSVRAVPCPGR
jgi:hypothetical protein